MMAVYNRNFEQLPTVEDESRSDKNDLAYDALLRGDLTFLWNLRNILWTLGRSQRKKKGKATKQTLMMNGQPTRTLNRESESLGHPEAVEQHEDDGLPKFEDDMFLPTRTNC